MRTIKNILAVIISYNPNENILAILKNINDQVESVLIIDNGSDSDTFLEQASKHFNCAVLKNSKNLGIAKALKIAKEYAIKNKFLWLLTLDQDSVPDNMFIEKLFLGFSQYSNSKKVAIISPIHQEKITKKIFEPDFFFKRLALNLEKNYIEMPWTLTSGNLIRLEIFQEIAGFDTGLFIDAVDTDFCFQCVDAGYKILVIPNVIMSHNVGYQAKGILHSRLASIHSPIRNYYQFRNRILLWKRHYKKHLPWTIRDFIYGTKKLLDNLLFADQKMLRLKLIMRGVWHGIIGKMGPYS